VLVLVAACMQKCHGAALLHGVMCIACAVDQRHEATHPVLKVGKPSKNDGKP
jgi:hypothetical protein